MILLFHTSSATCLRLLACRACEALAAAGATLRRYAAFRLPLSTTATVRVAADRHVLPKISIAPSIWQLGKNNLSTAGACCRSLQHHAAGADDPKSLRSPF
ncbi:MAG: hypothetical protein LBT94_03635 [Prevotellaceae bacterium]|nr:hypothetical protein [Prevotellaceae bacterium]